MAEKIPQSVWSGDIRVGDLYLRVHVLDTGERIIEAESLERFFAALAAEPEEDELGHTVNHPLTSDDVAEFARFARGRGVPA